MGKTNSFSIEFKACSTQEIHVWYYKSWQTYVTGVFIGPNGKENCVVLLDGCASQTAF